LRKEAAVIGCRPYGARVIEAHVTQDFRPGLYYHAPDGADFEQNRALAVAHPSPKTMGVPQPLRFGQRVGEKIPHLSGGFHRQLHARPVVDPRRPERVDPPTQRKPRWVGHPVLFMRYTLASKEWATRQVVTIANSIQETAMTTLPRAWPNSR